LQVRKKDQITHSSHHMSQRPGEGDRGKKKTKSVKKIKYSVI